VKTQIKVFKACDKLNSLVGAVVPNSTNLYLCPMLSYQMFMHFFIIWVILRVIPNVHASVQMYTMTG